MIIGDSMVFCPCMCHGLLELEPPNGTYKKLKGGEYIITEKDGSTLNENRLSRGLKVPCAPK